MGPGNDMSTLNMKLARERGLSKGDIKDLKALHIIVNMLLCEWEYGDVLTRKQVRRTLRRIEYQMQRLWGFAEDKANHTHWRRFHELYPTKAVTEIVEWW